MTGGSTTVAYVYDGLGQRVSKNVNGVSTQWLYNNGAIYAQYGTSWTNPVARYSQAGVDQPLLQGMVNANGSDGTANFYLADGLGSVLAMANSANATLVTQRFDPWGNKTAGNVPQSAQYGYTGREPDETGLMYNRARYYSPAIGRFVTRDPIGLQGGINQYAYVNGNPVNYTDPSGLILTQLGNAASTYYCDVSNALTSAGQGLQSFAQAHPQAIGNVVTGLGILSTIGAEIGSAGVDTPAVPAEIAASVVAGEATTASLTAAEQLAVNKAAGAAFEQTVEANLEQSGVNISQQITIETQSGVRTRLDFLIQDPFPLSA